MRPPASHSPVRRTGTLAGILRALGSLLVLLGLLGGMPWLLWEATGAALPAGLDDLTHLFSHQDTTGAFILALTAVGWISWAGFTLSLLVEIPAQLRGRTAPRLPGLQLGQRAAATLVGGIFLLLPTGTAMAAPAVPAAAATAEHLADAHHTPGPGGSQNTARDHKVPTAVATNVREYVVQDTRPAQSLWQIAEEQLGDGALFTKIVALNEGRTMTDGRVFTAGSPIQPGWTLHLPADTRTAGAPPQTTTQLGGTAEHQNSGTYVVESGDYLSTIAQEELGDGDRWPELYQANRDAITDPDVIHPGQRLDLPPGDANGPATPPEPASPPDRPADPTPDHEDAPAAPAPTGAPTSPPTPTPQPTQPNAPAPSRAGTPSAQPGTEPAHPGTSPSVPQRTTPPLPTSAPADELDGTAATGAPRHAALIAGIGALLAASLAGALAVKRILQQRRRRAGETIAVDEDPTEVEQLLTATGEPSSIDRLDTVLRTLAHRAAAIGRELPAVRGARIGHGSVHLIVDDPGIEPLAPFTLGTQAGMWRLDPDSPLLDGDTAGAEPAPYPGLVTLGSTETGELLLTNLLHQRTILLDGEADDGVAVARALTLEAGTSIWSDHTEILTVGLGTRLATLLPKGRIRAMPHLPSVTADLGEILVEVHQNKDQDGAPAPLPWILLCAGDIEPEQVWQFADAIGAARDLPLAVVLPSGPATLQAFPDAELLDVRPDAQVQLAQLDEQPVQLQRLTDAHYRQYIHALEVADEPAVPATGAWQLAEEHDTAATGQGRPFPLILKSHDADEDDSSPYPAFLAPLGPSQIKPVKSPTADGDEEQPAGAPEPASGTDPVVLDAGPGILEDKWEQESATAQINILGPLTVTGSTGSGHGPKVAALAALIHLRPGRTAQTLCAAMDPVTPWSIPTLRNRLSEIRSRFGAAPDGSPCLPRPKPGYTFHPAVRSDWDHFQHLATRGLAAGPAAGIPLLEDALALIRSRPLDGEDLPWAEPVQHEIISRIVDIAHTLATWHTHQTNQDLDAARHVILRGLDINETAEVLYRDWIHIEQTAGNTAGALKAATTVQEITRSYDISMQPRTEQTIAQALTSPSAEAHTGQR
ncbi:LysM peptidoglycan-binding domain-containing protein [Streptomyces sp. NPDC051098]|uniref:LysM peptidoglycan-binding domain-containing protein n=1 Tax=Streptomyces sp. NPDC051098 TaxID=3155411 RepID=UPI00342D453E